jgi:hypothetical protein
MIASNHQRAIIVGRHRFDDAPNLNTLSQASVRTNRSHRLHRFANQGLGTHRDCGRARALAPARPVSRSGVKQRHGAIPKTYVDSDILADRTNRARAAAATRRDSSLQAAGDENLLHLCGEASYVESTAKGRPDPLSADVAFT